jgi:hypothetical protein
MTRTPTPTELRAMLSVIHGVLDAADAQRGYQCDACADRDEGGGW